MDFSLRLLLLSPVEACVSVLFFGLALLAPVPAHLSTNALSAPWAFPLSSLLSLVALAVACVLSAPWAFSPSLPARALSAGGFPQTLLLTVLFRVHGTMGAKRRRRSRMQFVPSHGRSLRPGEAGGERSSCSCRPSVSSNAISGPSPASRPHRLQPSISAALHILYDPRGVDL